MTKIMELLTTSNWVKRTEAKQLITTEIIAELERLVTFKGVVSKDIVLVEVMKRITDRIKELKSKAKETQL